MPPEQDNSLNMAFDKGLQMAFPPVLVQLLKSLLEPFPSFASIAQYLQMDPMLAGKVLHLANTSNYGFNEKVTDLQRAAIALGTTELFKLVLVLSLQKKLNPTNARQPEFLYGDWRLTLWSAIAAEGIAGYLCPQQRKQAYLTAILKDLPLFLAFCIADVPAFLQKPRYVTMPEPSQFSEEVALWGRTHPEMSRDIFIYWDLPDELAQAVAVHHDLDGVGAYDPLAQSVIYATRWAELLHGMEVDPPKLIHFELSLAAELALTPEDMSEFRASCAARFNLLLGQLGIMQAKTEQRIHDQSLSSLQSHYFMALGTLYGASPQSSQAFALALQRQLRLFWNIQEWDMYVHLPTEREGRFFRCRKDGQLTSESMPQEKAPRRADWFTVPLECEPGRFGFVSVPLAAKSDAEQSSLPMFVRMIALHLDEYTKQPSIPEPPSASSPELPFVYARLDREGRVLEASLPFLDLFNLDAAPVGKPAHELLSKRLDIKLPQLADEGSGSSNVGYFLSIPEGRFPGTPLYLARTAIPGSKSGESYLFIGDTTRMGSVQALAMAHPELLSALFDTLNEQVCLLDEDGRVLWADESCAALLGKNIFTLSRPESPQRTGRPSPVPAGGWNKSFLANLSTSTRVQTMLAIGGSITPHLLTFAPLEGRHGRQYLLLIRYSPPQMAPAAPRAKETQSKSKDTLTDLYGYTQFHMLLKHMAELARKQQADTGIIFCDIEGLHKFNALHGCQKGDVMLRRVAGCLAENCRPGQDHACRYGADKFAVIVNKANKALMDSLASGIHHQVSERCGEEIVLNIGLVLVSPEEVPKVRLDSARKASEQASRTAGRTVWAE